MQTTIERRRLQARRAPAPVLARRLTYLDNLKALLVGAIIAAHGILGYTGFEGAWPYQPVQEVQTADVSDQLFGTLLLPAVVFAMGLFFLVSGLVTPRSLDRKGPRRFARHWVVRLGVPLALTMLVIWPALVFSTRKVAGWEGSYLEMFMDAEPFLDPGPMWFAGVLLIYSLAYAAWRSLRPRARGSQEALTAATLVLLAVAISAASMLVRPVFPFDSHQIGELQLWQWPQYVGMFWLGIAAARHGWFDPVPERIRHGCGVATLLGLVAFLLLFGAVLAAGYEPPDPFTDLRVHWAPLGLAAIEGPLTVAACVWLLGTAQRRLARPWRRSVTRSAYAAYVLQGVLLIGGALALRPLGLPAEVKALVLATGGVVGSFALAWLLVTRTPLRRAL